MCWFMIPRQLGLFLGYFVALRRTDPEPSGTTAQTSLFTAKISEKRHQLDATAPRLSHVGPFYPSPVCWAQAPQSKQTDKVGRLAGRDLGWGAGRRCAPQVRASCVRILPRPRCASFQCAPRAVSTADPKRVPVHDDSVRMRCSESAHTAEHEDRRDDARQWAQRHDHGRDGQLQLRVCAAQNCIRHQAHARDAAQRCGGRVRNQ